MKVDLEYRFPNHADEIYHEAQEFRQLTPTNRFLAIVEMMALGEEMLATSPCRDAALAQCEAHEEAGRQAVRELLAHHGF